MVSRFLKSWLPVLLWMALIFSASADTSSGRRSSRIIGPIVHWLVPDISGENLETIVFWVRKTAHVTEYAVLAMLLFRALRSQQGPSNSPGEFPGGLALIAFAVAVLYAITDEFHQVFVPSREGQVLDVLIDSLGAALGLLAVWIFFRLRRALTNAVTSKKVTDAGAAQ